MNRRVSLIGNTNGHDVCVIGAGPAGLGAAYEAVRKGLRPLVIERDHVVGGLSRTSEYNGYRFDIGGHRFYDKYAEITETWKEMLGDDWLERERMSRIFFRSRAFSYPLRPQEAFVGLGPIRSLKALASYLCAQARPVRQRRSFQDEVVARFGSELFRTFFKTYTEKVWGLDCSQISKDMADARIKGFSLGAALVSLLRPRARAPRTASSTFLYPRLGPGQLWAIYRERIEAGGGRFVFGQEVTEVNVQGDRVASVVTSSAGGLQRFSCPHVVSTMALRELCHAMRPAPPADITEAAAALGYRDMVVVVLIVDDPDPFPDTWIYVHEPGVRLCRIQNFKRWSPAMVSDQSRTCLGLEYFCYEGDGLWRMSDEELGALGADECRRLGLVDPARVVASITVRTPKAYPVYDLDYLAHTDRIAGFLAGIPNLEVAGRNGQHRYLTLDESVLAGILAVRKLLGEAVSPWDIRTTEY